MDIKSLKTKEFQPFQHQVAGSMPMLKRNTGEICKPAVANELKVYNTMKNENVKLQKFTPKYFGTLQVNVSELDYEDQKSPSNVSDRPGNSSKSSSVDNFEYFKDDEKKVGKRKLTRQLSSMSATKMNKKMALPEGKSPWSVNNLYRKFKKGRQQKVLSQMSETLSQSSIESEESEVVSSPGSKHNAEHEDHLVEDPKLKVVSHVVTDEQGNPLTIKMSESKTYMFIRLENLTDGLRYPNVMDLKMGTRQHGSHESDKKKESKTRKCKNSTSSTLGARVGGVQLYDLHTRMFSFRDKYWGRALKETGFVEALERLTNLNRDSETDENTSDEIKQIGRIIARDIATQLREMIEAVKESKFRLYGCSVLIAYDAKYFMMKPKEVEKISMQTEEHLVKVKIIDFANTEIEKKDGFDKGFVYGLTNLLHVFDSLSKGLEPEVPVAIPIPVN